MHGISKPKGDTMPKQLRFSSKEAAMAEEVLADSKPDVLGAAIVRIVHVCGVSMEVAAKAVGVSRFTASRYLKGFAKFVKNGVPEVTGHGGRRNELLSLEEEKTFLAEWHKRAEDGELVTIAPIVAALEAKIGRNVSDVAVYNMLKRNKWRKLMPDTKHPKQDIEKQEEFKKNSPKSWRPRD
jgi:transposase